MFGLEKTKLAIVFQLFGGTPHILQDGTRIRGDIHLLLIGDPSVGKSQLLKLASGMVPRGKYVSGKGVTGAGLTAAVVKDEQFLGGWVLEAGALVLANQSVCAIDEFEKMDKSDQVAMHEAMSLQQISIAKATIMATLPSRTSVLAGANPKLGRFDPYIPIREQIDLPETILSRFDVKFALRDIPDSEMDDKLITHILDSRHFEVEKTKPTINSEFIRKYIAYAKKNCEPILTKKAGQVLKDFYVNLRSRSGGEDAPIPITLRQYEALIRLAEASAKIRLSGEVTEEDANRSIDIMKYSLRQFGFDPETGMLDIDRAEGGTPTAQRNKIRIVLDSLEELHELIGKNIPMEEIRKKCKDEGVENVDEIIRKMKSEGLVFEPKPGFIQKV
jgi:replicative DNA helicase Mcm